MRTAESWFDVLVDVVERFGGSVIAAPRELAADGRTGDTSDWPASGRALVGLLTDHAAELLGAGLLVHHIPPSPGQPEWLAVTDVTTDLRARQREPLGAIQTPSVPVS